MIVKRVRQPESVSDPFRSGFPAVQWKLDGDDTLPRSSDVLEMENGCISNMRFLEITTIFR